MSTVESETDTRAVVEAFVDRVWNGDDPGALGDLTTPDFTLHQLVANEDHDRTSFGAFRDDMHDAMPDYSLVIEDLVVEGDAAMALLTMSGTPEKPLQAVKPTGESFTVNVFQKYRVEDGRVAEVWVMADAIGTLSQLGVFPPSPRLMVRIAAGKLRDRLFGG